MRWTFKFERYSFLLISENDWLLQCRTREELLGQLFSIEVPPQKTTQTSKISEEKLKFILSFFKDHRETFDIFDDSQIALDDVPFMCCRALLRDFNSQPYKKNDPLRFTACLFRGILFLHYLDPEQYINKERKSSEWEKTTTKWGHKLEQYLLSSKLSSRSQSFDTYSDKVLISPLHATNIYCNISVHSLLSVKVSHT